MLGYRCSAVNSAGRKNLKRIFANTIRRIMLLQEFEWLVYVIDAENIILNLGLVCVTFTWNVCLLLLPNVYVSLLSLVSFDLTW